MNRKPNKIDKGLSSMLEDKRIELLQDLIVPQSVNEYQLFVVDQRCGRCYHNKQMITVPLWAHDKPQSANGMDKIGNYNGPLLSQYWVYYLAHELAHACVIAAEQKYDHSPEFMKWFIKICPPELQFFELCYKPKNAAMAGVSLSSKQQTLIQAFRDMGYVQSLKTDTHVMMTKETDVGHHGQIIFNDGTCKTLQTVDAVRAHNNEEIRMSKYTKKELVDMTGKKLTEVYNKATGKNVKLVRDKGKAADEVMASQKKPGACAVVWETADKMKDASRADVIAACVAQDINKATASTQYQKWRKANANN